MFPTDQLVKAGFRWPIHSMSMFSSPGGTTILYDQVLPETKCEIFGNPADYYQVQICDPPVIEHGVLENGPFIGGLPIESPNQRGFSTAMFDCQRVYPLGY